VKRIDASLKEKIKKDIVEEAKKRAVSINYIAKKWKKCISVVQRMFWELEAEGKIIPIETSAVISEATPMMFFVTKEFLKKKLKGE